MHSLSPPYIKSSNKKKQNNETERPKPIIRLTDSPIRFWSNFSRETISMGRILCRVRSGYFYEHFLRKRIE